MKQIIYIIIFLLALNGLTAQSFDSFSQEKQSMLNVNLSAGAYVGASKSYAYGASYLAPSVSIKSNPKLEWGIGAFMMQGFSNFQQSQDFHSPFLKPQTGVFAYGKYFASDRISITGAVYQGLSSLSVTNLDLDNVKQNQSYYLNVDYKLNENTSFQIGFQYSNGRSPMPFGTPHKGIMLDGFNRTNPFFMY